MLSSKLWSIMYSMKLKKFYKVLGVFLSLSVGYALYSVFYYGLDPSLLAKLSFYQNLANPYVRVVTVQEGLRKEEVANIMADRLDWSEAEKIEFINAHLAFSGDSKEGRYFPDTYVLAKDASPREVSETMFEEFSKQIEKIKKPKSKKIMSEDTIIKIASIIQREAGGKSDMNLISGIIWNRIFSGMRLQMDATLQYVKGDEENGWWGDVDPEDKKLKSAYNTYLNTGLPPSPIANPGIAAIAAAYNPTATPCLYYLHDKKRQIHCAKTYEEHKKNIEKYY